MFIPGMSRHHKPTFTQIRRCIIFVILLAISGFVFVTMRMSPVKTVTSKTWLVSNVPGNSEKIPTSTERFWTISTQNMSTPNDVSCRKHLPKAAIIGASKCGTAALRLFLSSHPDIETGPFHDPKNGEYLQSVKYFEKHYEEGVDWYQNAMPCSRADQIVIDHTPQYFTGSPDMVDRIFRFNKTMRFLLILREPISRAVSQYLQHSATRNSFDTSRTVHEFLSSELKKVKANISSSIQESVYVNHLQRWLTVFNLSQFYIINGDEFAVNPHRQLSQIQQFLGVKSYLTTNNVYFDKNRGFFCVKREDRAKGYRCLSKGKGRPHPKLGKDLVHELQEYFEPYNEKLYELIGKRFTWVHNN